MDPLRWILLALGVALVAGIYFWDLWRRRRKQRDAILDDDDLDLLRSIDRSRGPHIDADLEEDLGDLRGLRGERAGLDRAEVDGLGHFSARAADEADEEPFREAPGSSRAAVKSARPRASGPRKSRLYAVEPAPEPKGEELIIVLNLMAEPGQLFSGPEIQAAMEAVEMRFGEMQIFHHNGVRDMSTAHAVFSAANILEPGTFDPARMPELQTPGLVLFMRLPGPLDPRVAFELMLNTGQRLAEYLGGELRDETRSVMSLQSIGTLRERIAEFGRRQMLATPG